MLWLRKKGFRINLRHLAGEQLGQVASAAVISAILWTCLQRQHMLVAASVQAQRQELPPGSTCLVHLAACHAEGQCLPVSLNVSSSKVTFARLPVLAAEYQTLVFLAIILFLLLYVMPFLFMIIGGLWRFLAEPLDEPVYGSPSRHQQKQDDWHPHHGQQRYNQQQKALNYGAQQQREHAFLKAQQSQQMPAPTSSQQASAGSQMSEQTAGTGDDANSVATNPRRPSHQQSWDQAIASAAASLDRASRQQQEQSASSRGRS